LKTSGKRVQKFHDHPNEFKDQFYKIKYPKKDDGMRLVTSNEGKEGSDEDGENDISKPQLRLPGEVE